MQLVVHISLDKPLILPLNYNHILQSVLYNALSVMPDYAEFLHDCGYHREKRQYKMYQFSQLKGPYRLEDGKIIFDSSVSFEVRSPEPLLIRLLADSFAYDGIRFGTVVYDRIHLELYNYTVEEQQLVIQMRSPVTVYSTDKLTGRTYYYNPEEPEFYEKIGENFRRKYQAYFGVLPYSSVYMAKVSGSRARKFVTKYQSSYITAWFMKMELAGERKYLDFLYQTGLGAKNSQGFGMFEIL